MRTSGRSQCGRDRAGRPPCRRRAPRPRATRSCRSRALARRRRHHRRRPRRGAGRRRGRSSTPPPGPSPERAGGDGVLHHRRPATCRRPASSAGVERIVVVSIIGSRPLHAAAMARRSSRTSGRCWPARSRRAILRAAQFHEFVAQLMEWGTQGDVAYVPKMRTQLVAARTVAEALADLATDPERAGAPAPILRSPARARRASSSWRSCSSARRGDAARIEAVSDPATPTRALRGGRAAARPGRHPAPARRSRQWLDAEGQKP